ncbi:MAG: carbonic anhydrase family protein [Bacteroidota bacterium]
MAISDNCKTQTAETQAAITPDEAIQMLQAGNQRFLQKKQCDRDLHQQVADTSTGQHPFAVVLGCIDSRVPAETVFDQGIGDIFNVRIAGNFVNRDILGSMEFSCKLAKSKAILVLGHSSCGAIKGAIDDAKLGNLTQMLDKLQPAVKAVVGDDTDYSSKDPALVQAVVNMNVKLTIQNIRKESPVLKAMEDNGEIVIRGGVYDISTGEVSIYPVAS